MKTTPLVAISSVVSCLVGLAVGNLALPPLDFSGTDPWRGVKALDVPDVRQSTTYSCGATALQAVLMYWGIEKREGDLMRLLGSSETGGTGPEKIMGLAKELGLKATSAENLTLDDIRKSLDRGIPVIVAIQAWTDDPRGFNWKEDWEDGHYVVVTGMDDKNVYMEDPSLLGSKGFIPLAEFEDRWHDYSGEPPLDERDRKYIRLGIFIEGHKSAPRQTYSKVD